MYGERNVINVISVIEWIKVMNLKGSFGVKEQVNASVVHAANILILIKAADIQMGIREKEIPIVAGGIGIEVKVQKDTGRCIPKILEWKAGGDFSMLRGRRRDATKKDTNTRIADNHSREDPVFHGRETEKQNEWKDSSDSGANKMEKHVWKLVYDNYS